jgi:hypothetical protein
LFFCAVLHLRHIFAVTFSCMLGHTGSFHSGIHCLFGQIFSRFRIVLLLSGGYLFGLPRSVASAALTITGCVKHRFFSLWGLFLSFSLSLGLRFDLSLSLGIQTFGLLQIFRCRELHSTDISVQ